ncbi:MAG TPA: hypothetical protein VE174_05535 [Actinomycetota bacterium]|nr:hypothetical protein [Actinomycetota bacterium]
MTFKRVFAALSLSIVLIAGAAPAAMAGGKCSPGQHGNPHPAFKPGSCK